MHAARTPRHAPPGRRAPSGGGARLGYDPFVIRATTTVLVDVSESDQSYQGVRLLDDKGNECGTRSPVSIKEVVVCSASRRDRTPVRVEGHVADG
jgi:hypothetical protein